MRTVSSTRTFALAVLSAFAPTALACGTRSDTREARSETTATTEHQLQSSSSTVPRIDPEDAQEVDILRQNEWGPLSGWDQDLVPFRIVLGPAGLLVLSISDAASDNAVVRIHTLNSSGEWITTRLDQLDQLAKAAWPFVGGHSFMVRIGDRLFESVDGNIWQESIDISGIGQPELSRFFARVKVRVDGAVSFLSLRDDHKLLAEWQSTKAGKWDRTDPPTVDSVMFGGAPNGESLTLEYRLDRGDTRFIEVSLGSVDRAGHELAFYDGSEWVIVHPFRDDSGAVVAGRILDFLWSPLLERYVAIAPQLYSTENRLVIGSSVDGLNWDMGFLDIPLGWELDPVLAQTSGGRLYLANRSGDGILYSTEDFKSWSRYDTGSDVIVSSLTNIGDGYCLAIGLGSNFESLALLGGPCPITNP